MARIVKAKKQQGKLIIKVKKGGLHTALGVKPGTKLTAAEEAVKPTDSPHMKKMKQFALNAKHFQH